MAESTEKLFKEYEKAFNALDVEKQVPLFAEHESQNYHVHCPSGRGEGDEGTWADIRAFFL